jgi:hypothetical protein
MEYPSQVFVWRTSTESGRLIWTPKEGPVAQLRKIPVARPGIPGISGGNAGEMILERVSYSVFAIQPERSVNPVSLEDPS